MTWMSKHVVGIVSSSSQTLEIADESRIWTGVNCKAVVHVKKFHPTRNISICLVDAVVSVGEEGQATYLGRMYPKIQLVGAAAGMVSGRSALR